MSSDHDDQLSASEDLDSDVESEASEPVPQTPRQSKKRSLEPDSSEKSKASPKSRSKAKQAKSKASPKKRAGRHLTAGCVAGKQRQCRSCQKQLDVSQFALNQANCVRCKRALDCIAKKARATGKKDWFKRTKSDPKRCKQMVNSYQKSVEEAEKEGRKNTWSIATYLHSVKATSKTRSVEAGKMMWEEEAIQYWESVPGGSMSRAAAKSKWDNMKENIEADNLITDTEGPKQAPLRIRIHTGDLVNFEGTYSRSKRLGCMWSSCFGPCHVKFRCLLQTSENSSGPPHRR